jgi:hypothetical protein
MTPERLAERRAHHAAIRARIRLIAAERNLPKTEIVFAGRLATGDLLRFAEDHRINLDWLIAGDLTGLLKTVRARAA